MISHAIHDNVLKFDMLGHVDPQAVKMQCDMVGISFKEIKDKIPNNDPEALISVLVSQGLASKEEYSQSGNRCFRIT
jgi:DNA polymerase-3 subunit alpha (Gram-positive type)